MIVIIGHKQHKNQSNMLMKYFFNACILLSLYSCTIFNMDLMKPKPHSIFYAPWREYYANKFNNPEDQKDTQNTSCILCAMVNNHHDTEHFIVHRANHSLIKLASQPYVSNGIHLLIVPYEHTRETSNLSSETYKEINILTQKICTLFSPSCHEIYINTNQGVSSGASIPDHHHKHIIINKSPRYFNLIQAIQETKTIVDLPLLFHTLQSDFVTFNGIITPQPLIHTLCKNNCYYCSILQKNSEQNLIIHKGQYSSIMLSHHPTYFGEIDIIPHQHIESIETLPSETYQEINELTVAIYPLLLRLLNTEDANIGLISYGHQAQHTEHIKQKIIPRKITWNTTSTTKGFHLNGNIVNFYKKLVSEWLAISQNQSTQQQAKL